MIKIFIIGILVVVLTVVSFTFYEKAKDSFGATTIVEKLQNKNFKEKSNIKGVEIAKVDFTGTYEDTTYGVTVEILSINAIEGGVEIFAKGWRGSQQLGFGKDGTIETERFLIYNPPILVDDSSGTIVKAWTDITTGQAKQRVLKEDPAAATRSVIAHNIKLVGLDNNKIVKGSVGQTTSTFFPASGANDPVDGDTSRGIQNENWATFRAAVGLAADDTSSPRQIMGGLTSAASSPNWRTMVRGIITFNTSAIPDTDEVDSAIFSFWAESVVDNATLNQGVTLSVSNPASASAVAIDDYVLPGNWGSTEFATRIDIGSVTTGAYNDMTLNSSGEANINISGNSNFGGRISADFDDIEASHPGSQQDALVQVSTADNSGTTQDPKLVVVHSEAPGGSSTQVIFIGM